MEIIEETQPHLVHFKNLNIDPDFYLKAMAAPEEAGIGIRKVKEILAREFPQLQFGYYNRTRENFFAPEAGAVLSVHPPQYTATEDGQSKEY